MNLDYLFAVMFLVPLSTDWLCYSNTQGKVYCFYCKLFGTGQNSFIKGFNDCNHVSEYIGSHERSPNYSSVESRDQLQKTE